MIEFIVLLVSAVGLFIIGFFPISNSIVDVETQPPKNIDNHVYNLTEIYHSHVDKSVLIIIDALRWDFITPKLMPLTVDLMNKKGCLSKVLVESPTVTLPRIKALTTGNIPQYIDLVRNLASSEILADSWLHSAQRNHLKIVFYGDNTWEKLFPDLFTRSEGTTSFFVWDFTEVDNNVTRNVNLELNREDWDIMILHYLGLDHIGHVLGPFSSRMVPKLQEMDEVIYKIHETISKKGRVATFITGDHGMRDTGGHGGTTQPEVTVPLVSLGLNCENSTFHQTDIPANLAALLGLNIPSTSIGNLQKALLQTLSLDQYLYASNYNTGLLLKKAKMIPESCDKATYFYKEFLKKGDQIFASESIKLYTSCSSELAKDIYDSSSKQNITLLWLALCIMFNILFICIYKLVVTQMYNFRLETVLYFTIMVAQVFICVSTICYILISISCVLISRTALKILKRMPVSLFSNNLTNFFLFSSILHPLTFISTSFIEEEHYFWIYFTITLFIFLAVNIGKQQNNFLSNNALNIVLILTLIRFLMDLNSTIENSVQNTNNWANFLSSKENCWYYLIFFIIGLVQVLFTLQTYFKASTNYTDAFLRFIILLLILFLKLLPYHNTFLGKSIWLLIFVQKLAFKDSWVSFWILVTTLLMKPHNVILIPIAVYTSIKLFSFIMQYNVPTITVAMYMVSNCFYFLQGHRNTLASVDISIGYIGLGDYYPLLVTSQVLIHTYTFQVLFHLITLQHFVNKKQQTFWITLLALRTSVVTFTCIIILIFRHHLFIWSVFAPKLFIESIHTLFLFLEISIWYCFNYIKNLTFLYKSLKTL